MKELLELLTSMKDLDPKVRETLEAKIKATEEALIGRNSREQKKAVKDAVEKAKAELKEDIEKAKAEVTEKDTELTKLTKDVEDIKEARATELYDKKFDGSGIDPKYKEYVKGKFKDNFEEALKEHPEWKQKEKIELKVRSIERPPTEGEATVPFTPKLVQGE